MRIGDGEGRARRGPGRLLTAGLCGVALVAVGPAVAGHAAPASGGCAAEVTTLIATGTPALDWAENLGYDRAGDLWVTRSLRNRVERYDRSGRVTATVAVDSPGAVRLGPDGWMYVVYGDSSTGYLGTHNSGVVRFDPAAATPVTQPFVAGFGMANGAAFDKAGNLYVADTSTGVVRVRPDGSVDTGWTARAAHSGVNGITVTDENIYTTVYSSIDGTVLRLPISDPGAASTVATVRLISGGPTALPDDLVAADGFLFAATTTGSLVRVDPGGHTVCTVYAGADPLTAVAVAPDGSLSISTIGGAILRVVPARS